jgi:hypothetical protein
MGKAKPKVQHIPYTNHTAAMTVPVGACANDPEKSNILCECCPLPSIIKYIARYLSVEPPTEEEANRTSYPQARPISSKGKGLLDIYGELVARKKYGTALLPEKAPELGITIHDNNKIERLLDEGEHASHPVDMDYGQGSTHSWGMDISSMSDWEIKAATGARTLSTGQETAKDTVPPPLEVIAIHPNAHLVCETSAQVELRWATFRKSEDMHWVQRHHPNMIIRANATPPPVAGPSSNN